MLILGKIKISRYHKGDFPQFKKFKMELDKITLKIYFIHLNKSKYCQIEIRIYVIKKGQAL
ncbi:hypothetical protein GLOIN_2v1554648 [Rhizophagus irregularis DAOM 181602=DAOM 197198]|uniref:Uncharacterized protein n=1 Tax=Rhizophagus irregularis (strain DAOM 181602 / DAOM 197198 / MUCL 43194) TaxID=747089 RepID=A0A2P4QG86_RHIID|nr:hypothetical protein GLOIN_2v1554648 [Rhizophagus irregularis DAOM 181602=DAOM 197198]POG76649.1 hypothetical protein GLOIN_2v1554648 [Rhizophagus irregularis DAOM 181602=DAOM 197198]|eukprot:XP_025183515.1 hypothetical protein GLOIN_2v1554648 [Rhizophagus irregularis DAOM 181602=DAOM 197198]